MSILEDRRAEFERRFTLDQEVSFRVAARKATLMGLWAAEVQGLTEDQVRQTGKDLSNWSFNNPGEEALTKRVAFLLAKGGVTPDPSHILAALKRTEKQAKQDIMTGEARPL